MLQSSYILLCLAFICITIRYIWPYVRRYVRWLAAINNVPGPSLVEEIKFVCQFPYKGEAKDMVNYLRVFGAKHIKNNPLIAIKAGPATCILLCKPEAVKVLLSSKTHLEKATLYKYFDIVFGDSIISRYPSIIVETDENVMHLMLSTLSEVAKWHPFRKLIAPAFNSQILDDFLQVINEQADILVHTLEQKHHQTNGGAFDGCPFIIRCSMDIICETIMGQRVNIQLNQDDDYIKSLTSLLDVIATRQFKPWLLFDWIYRFSHLKKVEIHSHNVANQFADKIIENKRREMADSKVIHGPNRQMSDEKLGTRRLPFLEMLLKNSKEDGEKGGGPVTDEGVRGEVNLFLRAGFHSSSVTMNWALYYIGSNPDVQQKIVDELCLVYGDCDRHITSSSLHNLNYLECVIKETLRLNPPVLTVGRHLTQDTNICGYTIPADTNVFAWIYWVHRDPVHYPDPDSFYPDRFLPENSQDSDPFAFLAFSAGPRNCIGQRFAMMEMKVVLASILRRFKVTTVALDLKIKNVNAMQFTHSPNNRIQLKPRDD